MLGIEYALLMLLSNSQPVMYCFTVLDGISRGLLSSIFLTTIWGDLGERYEKEKYYVFGKLTFLLSGLFSDLISPHAPIIHTTVAFSLASFFLFVSVLPLLYAPETLPEKKIKERQLRSYLESAKKVKIAYT